MDVGLAEEHGCSREAALWSGFTQGLWSLEPCTLLSVCCTPPHSSGQAAGPCVARRGLATRAGSFSPRPQRALPSRHLPVVGRCSELASPLLPSR